MKNTMRLSAVMLSAGLLLTGCFDSKESESGPVDAIAGFDPVPLPGNSTVIPFPFDGLFAGGAMPTLNIPNPTANPLVTQANLQDGYSTTASLFIDIFGFIDLATVPANLVIVNRNTGEILVHDVDFKLQTATVPDKTGIPLSSQRTRLLIEPLKPLAPSTTYLIGLKRGVKTSTGGQLMPSQMFPIMASGTPVANQTDPVLKQYSAAQKATLEALRSQLVNPAVAYLTTFGKVRASDLVLAYSVTTQSTTKTMDRLAAAATAQTIMVNATGLNTGNISAALPPVADIYAGFTRVPFYLQTSGGNPQSTAPLTSFWQANPASPDVSAKFLGVIPCGAYAAGAALPGGVTGAPSVSTTACFPDPVKQSDLDIPLLVTVPNAASGQAKPAGGWPVVIFQHGITRNRTDLIAVAPALAAAGFVGVAIDLPLHGVSKTGSDSAFRIPGIGERTFDLDLANNTTGAAGPDGVVDASGTHFINLQSLITSRDNLRQGAADLLTLRKSLANLDLNGDAVPDLDMSQVRFSAISLGGIVGGVFLGADSGAGQVVGAATLSATGGGIARLLDASRAYGPRISGGLAASGVAEGTDDYETFLRFAQTLIDSGDPLNYAVAARSGRPLLLTEVLGDNVIPNTALMLDSATATQDRTPLSGYLSGTEPLANVMGLTKVTPTLNGTPAAQTVLGANQGLWVQFNTGKHGSLLDPSHPDAAATNEQKAAYLAVTQEMQRQMVNFLKSNGACLPVGGNCPVPAP